MAGIIKVVPKEHWDIMCEYLMDSNGVILIPEEFYSGLSAETQFQLENVSNEYDFGGDADVMVELVTSEEHYLFVCAEAT